MTHLKKYWLWYLITIVVVVAVILAYSNWETIKGWFSSTDATNGRGRMQSSGSTSKKKCVDIGAGNCSYLGLLVPCNECAKRGITIT